MQLILITISVLFLLGGVTIIGDKLDEVPILPPGWWNNLPIGIGMLIVGVSIYWWRRDK